MPYLIISSDNEKHIVQAFYMATAASVGFPLARVHLVRGSLWLTEATGWWGTSVLRISDI